MPKDCKNQNIIDNCSDKNLKMQSLTQLYRIGRGPSSSHTIGPETICKYFLNKNLNADSFRVILYGSLAKTGMGHGTDKVIEKTLKPKKVEILLDLNTTCAKHPNTMDLYAYKDQNQIDYIRAYSVGGGRVTYEGVAEQPQLNIYPHNSFAEISSFCKQNNVDLCGYVQHFEGNQIWDYLHTVWQTMKKSIESGLIKEGVLPGGLNVKRKAKILINCDAKNDVDEQTTQNRIVCAYAFAVCEQNACGETIVTAPTCGASGVIPACMYYYQHKLFLSDEQIEKALAVGGIIGNLVKTNASISGAECGCQAEVGTACAMASACVGYLLGLNIEQIEYCAEIAIEHHLGLTCDPICGLVQIPCIERNAVASMRAINNVSLATFLSDSRRISLDNVIDTMRQTGLDISKNYKETSDGGLAKLKNLINN